MQTVGNLVVFLLNRKRFALRLSAVERVIRSVAVTPVANGSTSIFGVVSMAGRVVPVFDLRSRLGWPSKDIDLSDCFIVARTKHSPIILIADAVLGVVNYKPSSLIPIHRLLPNVDSVEGVACFSDGLIYLHDLDAFLVLGGISELASASATVCMRDIG